MGRVGGGRPSTAHRLPSPDPPVPTEQARCRGEQISGTVGWWGPAPVFVTSLEACVTQSFLPGLHLLTFQQPPNASQPDKVGKWGEEPSLECRRAWSSEFSFFQMDLFKKIVLFVYLSLTLAVLGLHCCVGFSLVVEGRGCSRVTVHRLLTVLASLVEEHGL